MNYDYQTSLIEHLTRLVAFKTESRSPKHSETCLDYVEKALKENVKEVSRIASNGFPSLFFSTKPTKTPRILLQAHIDVVPASKSAYKLKTKSNKLYGRGVYDMKFAAACYLTLIEDLKDTLKEYDLGIMLTSDEEIGGENGVGYLLHKGYGADVCILPDGGDNWAIETSSNAIWLTNLIASGTSAHGSRPWEGRNAIINLVAALDEIRHLFGEQKAFQNSLTISQIAGGQAINQVPDHAEATLDMRFTTLAAYKNTRKAIEALAERRQIKIKDEAFVEGSNFDIKSPEFANFIKIAEDFHGAPLENFHSLGASDSRFFVAKNIPVIIMRPTGGNPHGDNEWIDKNELFKFYELLKLYVVKSAKSLTA